MVRAMGMSGGLFPRESYMCGKRTLFWLFVTVVSGVSGAKLMPACREREIKYLAREINLDLI